MKHQFINEDNFSGAPKIGDTVFVCGFADDAGVVINNFAAYGTIVEARADKYAVDFEAIFDSAGESDNGPEGITFTSSDIVSGCNGTWAVVKQSMQFE